MKNVLRLSFLMLVVILSSCKTAKYPDLSDGLYADVQTSKGDILLYLEYVNTPITVANFVSLAEGTNPFVAEEFKGKPFYNGLIFHRVVPDFILQGGDPRGNGTGDPGYRFEDEFPVDDEGNILLSHDRAGVLSMANGGPDSNGSQFFITFKEAQFLDGRHSVFGHVVVGQDVVDTIQKNDVIEKVEIIRVGKEAENFDAAKEFEDYFSGVIEKKKEEEAAKERVKAELLNLVKEKEATAVVMPSGLKIIKIKEGSDKKPTVGSKVNVFYAGYFQTGDLFDSNNREIAKKNGKYDKRRDDMQGYEPFPMDYSPDARLIAGFREGLLQMNYGDKVLLLIPSHLGYGEQGSGSAIPPNADLIFELEILE
ncbi:peptidylprolyl isomerase [Namhaeicola litoreus]|uniref:peptidylprolyl isomerase n=1 Tax=Namhaeicola litoreus TaxID=1052145 RepID=A0ABW3Y3V4_9FLAO